MSEQELDQLECNICHRNIRKSGNFPIYSKKFDVICRDCCLLGSLYKNDMLRAKQFDEIPEDIREKIKQIYPDEV